MEEKLNKLKALVTELDVGYNERGGILSNIFHTIIEMFETTCKSTENNSTENNSTERKSTWEYRGEGSLDSSSW